MLIWGLLLDGLPERISTFKPHCFMETTDKIIIKILVDMENQKIGIINVESNTEFPSTKLAKEFLALVFKSLYDQYQLSVDAENHVEN